MSATAIQEHISELGSGDYHPIELDSKEIGIQSGTTITLRDLKKGLVNTEANLRRRLARRFSVIGAENEFQVAVNGLEISVKDRDYYGNIEFLWYFGEGSAHYIARCRDVIKKFRQDDVLDAENNYRVRGWIGTVDDQKNIDEQNNTIVVFANGKLIHEDLLSDLKEPGVYSKYIIGEIDADFMDDNLKPDIVTSNRQSVKENDDRYDLLRAYVQTVLKKIQSQWTNLRKGTGTKKALLIPVVKEWYDSLEGDHKKYAQLMFGKIASMKVDDGIAKKELYKSSILAFERLALTKTLSVLDTIESDEDFALLAKVFSSLDEIERVQYYQIVKGRLGIIRDFEKMLAISKERALQLFIFDHLWLLSPAWERASTNERIEQTVRREFDKIDAKLTDDEKAGRIDIRYRTAAGKNIIIELKKYNRHVDVEELIPQIRKYRDALRKCLRDSFPNEPSQIETICILGERPRPLSEPEENERLLSTVGARAITYDSLIADARRSYEDYLDKDKQVSKLATILDRIDAEYGADVSDIVSGVAED